MARIFRMYNTTKNKLTVNNIQSTIDDVKPRTYSIVCYDLDSNKSAGNRDIIQTTYSGEENDLPTILNHVRIEHPKAKIELYINELRLNISSIEVIAFL